MIDQFIELMAYTLHFRRELEKGHPSFPEVRERYDRLLARLEESSGKEGGADSRRPGFFWEDACFAVYAWVDETILVSSWAEKEKWQEEMLQARYFGTTNGGVEFFERLNRLMAESGNKRPEADLQVFNPPDRAEDGREEALEVFSYCLALGFKGKYFLAGQQEELRNVKSRVLEKVRGESGPAFPERIFLKEYPPLESRRGVWPSGLLSLSKILLYLAPVALFGGLYLFYYHFLQTLFAGYLVAG